MTTELIHLNENGPIREALASTITALRAGKLVVFPTETVYGLGALASNEEAMARLIAAKGRRAGHALPVAIAGESVLRSYVPEVDEISERLARRCWPGPITLVLDTHSPESRMSRLPERSREAIMPSGSTGFRVPDQPFFLELLRQLDEPVVLTSANLTGEPPATTADAAKVGLGDRPDLILDAGEARFAFPSTVVSVSGNRINILRDGALSKERIKRMTAKIILFICTGNTCRSPMAEVICAQLLARRLHCEPEELEQNGYVIMSAGVAAFPSAGANPTACEVMKSRGLSLDLHQAQPVTEELLRFADHIYVMSHSHAEAVRGEWPRQAERVSLLKTDGGDIDDPLGGNFTVYLRCAKQLETEIERRLDEIL